MADQEHRIGRFRLRPGRCLLDGGNPVEIGSKALDILSALVDAAGDLVTKDELMAAAWPGMVIEENVIQVHVSALRKVLGAESRRIVTVRGLGYRYIATEAAAATASGAAHPLGGNLPTPASELIGRGAALDELRDLLRRHRLVTLAGGGGIGKTRLALRLGRELAAEFPDGVWFVALEQLTRPELVAEAVAGAVQLPLLDDRSAVDSVTAFVKDKRLLLILDNAEHLIGEVALVASALLARAARVVVLVTSREVAGLPDEQVFRVPGLELPAAADGLTAEAAMRHAAIRLFVERADAALGGFVLTDAAAPCIAQICRQLDGIPLAIELAATRMKLLAATDLLAGLTDRFRLLSRGNRVAQPRHQTLYAAIDWSHTLLSEAERVLFRRLSVFGGSFTIAVAAGAPLDPAQVFDLLGALVDKSLLVPIDGSGMRRFRLLDSTRAFAREQLERSGESDRPRLLITHLIRHFTDAEASYQTIASAIWLSVHEPELENLRAGLGWGFGPGGDPALAVELVGLTREFWHELSLIPERRRWFGLAADFVGAATPPAIAARIHSGLCEGDFGVPRDRDRALIAVRLLRQTDDRLRLAFALLQAGTASAQPGNVSEAEPYFQEALALLRPLGQTKCLAFLLAPMGVARVFAGDLPGARALMLESLAVAQATGFGRQIELLQFNLAEIAFIAGDTAEAIDRARNNQASCRRSGNLRILATTLQSLAGYLLAADQVVEARTAARDGLRLQQALGRAWRATGCIEHLALAAALTGDVPLSARLAGYGDAHYAALGRVREPAEQKGWDRLQALLRASLAAGELDRLMAEGAAMEHEGAVVMALGE